jgi:hypothetical protein
MSNKTALQDLIEWMEEVNAPSGIIKKAKSLLAKERQQIIAAFDRGIEDNQMSIELKNLNPKEDAITYKIETVKDIIKCVTSENVEGFLKDFEGFLHSILLMKSLDEQIIKEANLPIESLIECTYFEWTDDWKIETVNHAK